MSDILAQALEIASTEDVTTKPNSAVVYSVSYMPHDKNKQQALAFVKRQTTAKMLDDTPCGKALINLGLDGKVNEVGEEITKIWRVASSRYIAAASGNINAFVEGADERSTFCTTELSEILKNPNITQINGIDKTKFAENFTPQHYANI
ncbi:MAG: hypothetical protein J6C85_01360 [Alphaproteobacteria bacterium]|nr:hypothetical protein [Alphaproteobacteria bacterium]